MVYQTTTDLVTYTATQPVGRAIGVPVGSTTSNFGIARLAAGTWVLGWVGAPLVGEGPVRMPGLRGCRDAMPPGRARRAAGAGARYRL